MSESVQKLEVNNTGTLTDNVYLSLRDGIVSGKIPPGTRLVHRKLAKQLGTSSIPVVAALRQLEGAGLLVTRPGEGSEVRRWDPQQYEESFLIRAALEGVAYRFFALRADDEDFRKLEEFSAAFDAACEAGDWGATVQADREFHLYIVRGSRSDELIRMVENASLILLTIRAVMLPPEMRIIGAVGAHKPLIEALKTRDPDLSEEEGRKHLLQSQAFKALQRSLSDTATLQNAETTALRQLTLTD